MKKVSLILGIILALVGFLQGIKYIFEYNTLMQYDKGYVWGSIILFVIGLVLIYFGLRKKKTKS
ncbi:MAG TPA: hypothetical protein PL115_00695 [Bacteroidales bacterium]|jgi:ABC-type multidrug transport system permease subunit|nr:hypothetical protein [Bacteroidales bacterium]HPH52602.1 hypothetical protein [Bacteroidales bacterium]HPY21521.1 hypothetical protein [Bacteroidales bacterium]HQN24023.1 hypothetical protein [Bacteroidales bacterium]HQP78362.1 hypothetical protein [Bacteroidales bacterium]